MASSRSCFNICSTVALKLLTRLRVGRCHLNEHKLKHDFSNYINSLCCYSLEVESMTHFFLHCLCFSSICKILSYDLVSILNSLIINASFSYIIKSECFKGNIFELISIQCYILSYPEIVPLSYIILRIQNISPVVFCSFSSFYHFYRWLRIYVSCSRGSFRLKLSPTFRCCPWWLIFFKNLFYQKKSLWT